MANNVIQHKGVLKKQSLVSTSTDYTSRKSHNPRLDTIEMVEDVLSSNLEFSSRTALWKALPKSMQQKTLKRTLDYLERSKKIICDGNSILWVFADSDKLQKLHKNSVKLR